jgi:ABC-type multidrug transport system ATPase subunit
MDRRSVEERAVKALDEFGLGHRVNDRVAVLSAGMRRRAALAIHLQSGRAHIILDEPFANLDDGGQRTLREALSRCVAEGCGIALVVHDLALLEGTKYRVVRLEEGKVVPL